MRPKQRLPRSIGAETLLAALVAVGAAGPAGCSSPRNEGIASPDAGPDLLGGADQAAELPAMPPPEGGAPPSDARADALGTGGTGSGGVPSDGDGGVRIDQVAEVPPVGGATTCPPNARVCDGFEAAEVNSLWTTFWDPAAAAEVAIDRTRSARGSSSMRLLGKPGQKGELGFGTTIAIPNPAYLRFYIYTGVGTAQRGGGLVTLDDGGTPQRSIDLGWEDTTIDLSGDVLGAKPSRAQALPHEQWTCVVIKIDSNVPGEMSVFLGGAQVPSLTSTFTTPIALKRLMFSQSFDIQSSATPFAAWIDEVALSAAPIGCTD